IFFAHGLQKLGDIRGFGENALVPMGVPAILAYAITAAEFGGGLLLLTGILVRVGAFGHLCVMAGAVAMVHWGNGLSGAGGYEFPLTLLGSSVALLILGPDPLSVDRNLSASMSRSIDVKGLPVKMAALLLVLAGIALPVGGERLGIPPGRIALASAAAAGLVAVAAGTAVLMGKQRAYLPALAMARLFVGGSALLLLWIKYTIRGSVALALSLLIVAALRSARRNG
ncbi:MAG TPA: DoxX family protein, partial [Blastocatellia bacterium]|nr:DoxX family protein [Blastocatellia bacterium]